MEGSEGNRMAVDVGGGGIRIFDFFTDVINARPINQLTFCVIFLLKRSKLGRKKIYLHSFDSN